MTTHADKLVAECMALADEYARRYYVAGKYSEVAETHVRQQEGRAALEAAIRTLVPPNKEPATLLSDDQIDQLAMDSDGLPNSHLELARAVIAAAEPLIRASERERCAKVCEAGVSADTDWDVWIWNDACGNRAHAIRSLGTEGGEHAAGG